MNKIEQLIEELCPDGVECEELGKVCLSVNAGGDLPEIFNKGQKFPTTEFPYPIYSNGCDDNALYGFTDKYKIDSDAVTISARGTIGYHTVREAKYTPIVRLISLIPNKELITTRFLNYILDMTPIGGTNGGIPQLTVPTVKRISIPLPPLPIQQEIVTILDTFTALDASLQAELEVRRKQYEHYRNQLLNFEGKEVEWKMLGECLQRTKGTPITAQQMSEINKEGAPIKIFAGGKTVAYVDYGDIPEKDILTKKSIVVKSRGIIEFEYIDKPFSHKNEFWSYHSNNSNIIIKYVFYYLKCKEPYFQSVGQRMSKMPQLSIPDTDKYSIPIPPLSEQERIVGILDKFDALVNTELPAEIAARRKQYEYYREKLLTFEPLAN